MKPFPFDDPYKTTVQGLIEIYFMNGSLEDMIHFERARSWDGKVYLMSLNNILVTMDNVIEVLVYVSKILFLFEDFF